MHVNCPQRWLQRAVQLTGASARLAEDRAGRRLLRIQNRGEGDITVFVGRPGPESESFIVGPNEFFEFRDPAPDCVVYGSGEGPVIVLEG